MNGFARTGCLLLGLVFLARAGFGQDAATADLVRAAIPDSLRVHAAVVERVNETEVEIESARKAKIRRRVVFTILNASGDGFATLHTFYDKFHDLVSATGILYDADGKV